ncbi:ESX-1 secretion-associated EspK domain protein [Mycobacterium ulcerans str. Harvey]|uniref:ESX-1 secretion-associated EspK domain protein n=1 Tax=Mycobacterium ulcerans str. Harvey TaxID=1299332 RepID=A0ABN0RA21_MYCUL|nr:ESX-1 secretion-associated EspK domain protein [Mycobacterium ulcerans str. Harvey]
MSMLRPTGGYFDQLLEPGGWPEIDEDAFYERAQEFTQVLRQVTEVLESCQQRRTQVFDDGVWSGGAADAANGELGTNIGHLMTLQNDLATAITWHKYVAGLVVQAKLAIDTNAEVAHQQILVLQNEPGLTAAERAIAIESLVVATHGANVAVVAGTTSRFSRAGRGPPRVMRWKTCSTSGHRTAAPRSAGVQTGSVERRPG